MKKGHYPSPMRIVTCCFALALASAAEEAAQAPNWTLGGKIGGQLASVTTGNGDTSRDPSISGAERSTAWSAYLESTLQWRRDQQWWQQDLKARYGAVKKADESWAENSDEVRYDTVYRYLFAKPWFLYASGGAQTVFTGPDPQQYRLDPITGKASAGIGQVWEDLWVPMKDRLEWRLGHRAQRRWGPSLSEDDRLTQNGPEAFARYERKVTEELSFWIQYEGFAETNDLGHVTNLGTAGLTLILARQTAWLPSIQLDANLRVFYETRVKEDRDSQLAGFNQWGVRQETLVGAVYTF